MNKSGWWSFFLISWEQDKRERDWGESAKRATQPTPPDSGAQWGEKKTHPRWRASQNPRTLAAAKTRRWVKVSARVRRSPPQKKTHTTAKAHDLCSAKEASTSPARGLGKTHTTRTKRCQGYLKTEGGLRQPSTRAGINLTAF